MREYGELPKRQVGCNISDQGYARLFAAIPAPLGWLNLFFGGAPLITKIVVLGSYFALMLVLGFLARSRLRNGPNEYYLGGRKLSTFLLVGTIAATNFSAFTIFGVSGAGYRDGLAFYPIMAFGTGFMALSFLLLGRKIWQIGREHNLITPAELVHTIYKNRALSVTFAAVMVVFTIPYLALQPLAGGKVFSQLFDTPPWVGALLVTGAILIYTLMGGLKAVAWTDALQGFLMLGLMTVALGLAISHHGGWVATFSRIGEASPALLSRPGDQGMYTPAIWFSFIFLWFFCDPMFPQIFQRFYMARSQRALTQTAILYPLLCTVFFALPVTLGVIGRLEFPGLKGPEADNIVPLLATSLGGDLIGTLVMTAGLAALMSTMDSQLLTLGSIFSRDLYPLFSNKKAEKGLVNRLFVFALAVAGLIVALGSDATILDLGVTAFTGLAVLFPTVFFGLYLNKPSPGAAICSILIGEFLVVLYHLRLLPSFGFLSVVPILAVSTIAYLLVQGTFSRLYIPRVGARHGVAFTLFFAIFVAAMDFWRWGEVGELLWGWPTWAWYFVGLSIAQSLITWWWLKREPSPSP